MYKVRIEKTVQKAIEKIEDPFYSKIKTAILGLAKNPYPRGYTKLKGREGYRIRVAHFCIIYRIIDTMLLVEVIDFGQRKDIYK
ncbi:MAG: type II toxin-antitoxin system RelE/ParE family toxin [Flavobacteriaceae bacterium]|nr:type II toxin-antitoxin system RelE/ParE family toxin [Flavobacteriaceae bacterium]